MSEYPIVELAAMQSRANAAPAGPWSADDGSYTVYGADGSMVCADLADGETSEFIAHAREDIPFLVALVKAQALKLDSVRLLANDMSTFPDLVPPKAMAGLIKGAMEARK